MTRGPRPSDLFTRAGYVRVPNEARQEASGRKYHKGWEVRLVAQDQDEARRIFELALAVGYRAGRIFAKHRQFVVPIYGKEAVEVFLRLRRRESAEPVDIRPRRTRRVRAEIHDLVD